MNSASVCSSWMNWWAVFVSSVTGVFHFLSVGQFVVVPDETHHCRVVRVLNEMVGSELARQSWVIRVKSSGLSTDPGGEPVLRKMTLEVFLPTLTDWDLSVRNSSSQLRKGRERIFWGPPRGQVKE
ncbi:hypothetical protein GOODEAATRI_033564 [Goodea atripinnis]|uniref:Uncharacterized protein n=1 Tax=Goodea atripinnis TaxID=208336 RepID=A0ABV0NJ68_9TELE